MDILDVYRSFVIVNNIKIIKKLKIKLKIGTEYLKNDCENSRCLSKSN